MGQLNKQITMTESINNLMTTNNFIDIHRLKIGNISRKKKFSTYCLQTKERLMVNMFTIFNILLYCYVTKNLNNELNKIFSIPTFNLMGANQLINDN